MLKLKNSLPFLQSFRRIQSASTQNNFGTETFAKKYTWSFKDNPELPLPMTTLLDERQI